MAEEFEEYTIFTTKTSDGREVEMAVVDEFEFEKKTYVAAALVEGDTINADGLYIYRAKVENDVFKAEKIHTQHDYERICEAYMEYCDARDGEGSAEGGEETAE